MRRPKLQTGQICFELPEIVDFSKPAVELHKNGRHLLFKPLDPVAADTLRHLIERMDAQVFRYGTSHWSLPIDEGKKAEVIVTDWKKIELWKHLRGDIANHPLCILLKHVGVEVGTVPTLANYIRKELRKQEIENTPFPMPAVSGSATLFQRSSVGTNLLCIKDYVDPGSTTAIFKKGKHYLVVSTGGNGTDVVRISTSELRDNVTLQDKLNSFEWTTFHPEMETYFDDSEETEMGKTVDQAYPELVAMMRKKMEKLGYPVFDHTLIDAPMEALKRGVLNCKLMRMGKAQPLDAKLLTTSGWKSMRDIQVRDKVFGEDGLPHIVTAIYPQGEKTVYRVTFSDGSSTECCDEHLWKVYTAEWKYSYRGTKVLPLSKLKDRLKFSNGNTRYYIPLVSPIQFERVNLPIDPYLLGCLLGDGTLGLRSNGYGTPQFTSEDQELLDEVESRLPSGMELRFAEGCTYNAVIPQGWQINPLGAALSKLDLRHKANEKWIPNQYKFASVEQRLELLRGLMDTDGSVWLQTKPNAAPIVEFTSVSEELCDDVAYLVRSFGGITTKDIKDPFYYNEEGKKIPCQTAYRVRICMPAGFNPFKLKRKAILWRPAEKFKPSRGMVQVEKIGKKECQCITVDSENHLYVTDNLILTHNTREAISIVNLWGSEKIAVFGSENVRLTWEKEFNKIGIKDYVMVDALSDLEKPGRFYLMKYGWIRRKVDPTDLERRKYRNYLRVSEREVTRQVSWMTKSSSITVYQHNPCPHCGAPMERPELQKGSSALSNTYKVKWVRSRGYICRNPDCTWKSDNRKIKGTAWDGKLVKHKGGTYVDYGLAAHVNCPEGSVKGRICKCCGVTDGVWVPQVTKRFKKFFSVAIADEIHHVKDIGTQTAEAVYRIRARRRIGLTGTLLSNSPLDAYWIMSWVIGGPSEAFPYLYIEGRRAFEERFCDHAVLEKPTGEKDEETGEEITKTIRRRLPYFKNAPDWWRFSSPKILRRNYDDPLYKASLLAAGMQMPTYDIETMTVQMIPDQIKLMLSALKDFKDVYEKAVKEAKDKNRDLNKAFVMSQMTAMRIVATIPSFINKNFDENVYTGEPGGGKMYAIETTTKNAILQGGKVVILSDFIEMQKQVQETLKDYGVIRFDTAWDQDQRREALERFNDDPEARIMVAGTRAVSESLDFSVADTCICCDVLWAPADQCQAWSRLLTPTTRKRTAKIYLVLSKNSIDEHIHSVFYAKMKMSEQGMDRRTVNRRAMEVNYQMFAERVLEEEANLSIQILGSEQDDKTSLMLGDVNAELMEDRPD